MRYCYLPKKDLGKFIELLKQGKRLVAPVKKENQFVFADIDEVDDICLEYIPTILPPKKYFMPQHETLGKFDLGKVQMKETAIEMQPTVLFGVHTCDLEGIECLEGVFHLDPEDPYYVKREKFLFIVGYECMHPCDEYATCITMDTLNPKAGYDIMMTDYGENYILHINSAAADEFLRDVSFVVHDGKDDLKVILRGLRKEKVSRFDEKLEAGYKDLYKVMSKGYESKIWEESVGKRCVSCGNCTAVCPTCYCFDIIDDVNLDMKEGTRERVWDSCQLEEFAAVAGGENFREDRSSRQRHRYLRKFVYPIKKFNKFFCTGCGRCSRTCMAGISLIETVNELTKECNNAK